MVEGQVLLSTVPRSYGPSPPQQRQPQHLKKHGRHYSIQLDVNDNPLERIDNPVQEMGKPLPSLPAAEQYHPPSSTPPEESPLAEEAAIQASRPGPSSEELFARRFGYGPPAHLVSPSTELDEEVEAPLSRPRPRSIQRRLTPFSDDDEGCLIVLPSPPLLRPASFWRNTHRTALHTPSLHIVRRATFLAAGLALDKPVCDLSAFAVESRITVGKTKGLSGSAGIPIGWSVFG